VLPTDAIKSNHNHARGPFSFAGEADKQPPQQRQQKNDDDASSDDIVSPSPQTFVDGCA
jgi:hypothetical protein